MKLVKIERAHKGFKFFLLKYRVRECTLAKEDEDLYVVYMIKGRGSSNLICDLDLGRTI